MSAIEIKTTEKMPILVVLTEHFLPSNTPGANRAVSWAKYLPEHGFYPVFFTRNVVNEEYHHVVTNETYQVHYIECGGGLFYKLRRKYAGSLFGTFCGLIDSIVREWPLFGWLYPMYRPVLEYVSSHRVAGILATAPGFSIYGVASGVSRKTGCKWIADYRDTWTNSEILTGFGRVVNAINRPIERHYLSNVSAFCTVSPWYVEKIERLLGRTRGHLVENGFETGDDSSPVQSVPTVDEILDDNKFTILYPGSLYDNQKLTFFLNVLQCMSPDVIGSLVLAIVGEEEAVVYKNNPALKPFANSVVRVYEWVEKSVADRLIMNCDAVIYVAHLSADGTPVRGIPSSKLYEYIRHRKRVLMAPSDSDFAEYKLNQCGLAVVEPSAEDFAKRLTRMVNDKKDGLTRTPVVPDEIYSRNTREHAARVLADVLREHLL